jgi:hypothetical protein
MIEEENTLVLLSKWRCATKSITETAKVGSLHPTVLQELMQLVQSQVERAASCWMPLFELNVTADHLRRVFDAEPLDPDQFSSFQQALINEARTMLLNRWQVAREGNTAANRLIFGMEDSVCTVLREATQGQILRAALSGTIKPVFTVTSKYLFHAARHPGLTPVQRTTFVTCAKQVNLSVAA